MKRLFPCLLTAFIILGLYNSCDVLQSSNPEEIKAPKIETLGVERGDLYKASASGRVTGLTAIGLDFECGIEYSTQSNFGVDSTWRIKADVNYSEEIYTVILSPISYAQTYYYRAYYINQLVTYYGETKSFSLTWEDYNEAKEEDAIIQMEDVNKGVRMVLGADGIKYPVVDLGLNSGTLWATCNLGANSPEQTGFFYAWGETATKTRFGWDNYAFSDGDELSINKYCADREHGNPDWLMRLDKADDAAYVALGNSWQIPTNTDFKELMTKKNCEIKWCKLNGVGGFLFTSVRKGFEGNCIFIPLAGMKDFDQVRYVGEYGWYWCDELYLNLDSKYVSSEASVLWLQHTDIDEHRIKSRQRCVGLTIRPVFKE